MAVEVGADRDQHDAGRRGSPAAGQRGGERGALALVAAGREQLLELVDGEHRAAASTPAVALLERAQRVLARPQQRSPSARCPAARRRQRRQQAGAQRRDLPLPDGPTTASSGAPASRATSSATSRSRPKNTSRVVDVERRQALERAHGGAVRRPRGRPRSRSASCIAAATSPASSSSAARSPARSAAAPSAPAPTRRAASASARPGSARGGELAGQIELGSWRRIAS